MTTTDTPACSLTPLQRDVLALVGRGRTLYAIGRALGVGEHAARHQLRMAYRALGASSATRALVLAIARGDLDPAELVS